MYRNHFSITKIIFSLFAVLAFSCVSKEILPKDDPPITYTVLRNGILDGQELLTIRYLEDSGKVGETTGYVRSSGNAETVLLYTFNEKDRQYATKEIAIKNLIRISKIKK
jgi:hypothetical protein